MISTHKRSPVISFCTSVALLLLVVGSGSIQAFPRADTRDLSDGPVVDYSIEAFLLPGNNEVTGSEVLIWQNKQPLPATYLDFHLYYNAFADESSTFLKKYASRGGSAKQKAFGSITINEFRVIGGENLISKISYISPDDQNRKDKTVIRIPLDKPVKTGEKIQLKIGFKLKIPEIFARTGRADDYYFISQWYPKIGVFQADGTWNCHQYHPYSEFFADFGNYRAAVTVPEKFVFGATGAITRKDVNPDGTVTYIVRENRIHDFAWVAYPHFSKTEKTVTLDPGGKKVKIILLLAPGHEKAENRYLQSLEFTLNFFARHIFPYPYAQITVVDPPINALGSGGMEYPTLITAGYTTLLPDCFKFTELVTIHEFGHQYWYGIIASNEFEEAWLDEGINTFFEMEIIEAYFKNSASLIDCPLLKISDPEFHRLKGLYNRSGDKVNQWSWKFLDSQAYSSLAYSRAAIFLATMKNFLGKKNMYDFFRHYARTYRFKHPGSADFIREFNAFTGKDFSWAFDQFINGNSDLDLAVGSVSSTPVKNSSGEFENRVLLLRKNGYFPAEVLVKLENGREIKSVWNDRSSWKILKFKNNSPIEFAAIDPEYKILLDRNLVNNSMRRKSNRKGLRREAFKLGFFFQALLSLIKI